jgi:succinoglycan biosynthesis transport protein ExoP
MPHTVEMSGSPLNDVRPTGAGHYDFAPPHHGGAALRRYLDMVRRRKWVIALTAVLLPAAAVAASLTLQEPRYEGVAKVALSRANLANQLTGTTDSSFGFGEFDRFLRTQAELARSPAVVSAVVEASGSDTLTVDGFLEDSVVEPQQDADLLRFRVLSAPAASARRLADDYARQYVAYRRTLDTVAVERARRSVQRTLAQLDDQGPGARDSELVSRLREKEEDLATFAALQTSNANIVPSLPKAEQVQPKPVRNGVLGLVLGLGLGVGLALLADALDTRIRSASEVATVLGLPILARLPAPSRQLASGDNLVMQVEPNSPAAESVRILRTSLTLLNYQKPYRIIMVTSAMPGEGKSTTVANLGIALARSGRRVAIIDLDLRRPRLARLFDLDNSRGITSLRPGVEDLGDVATLVPLGTEAESAEETSDTNGGRHADGLLAVVPSGPRHPHPAEFIMSETFVSTLESLVRDVDAVILDCPPLLELSDTLALSDRVDGVLVIARLGAVRRPALWELRNILDRLPTDKLGVALTGAEADRGYGYDSPAYTEAPAGITGTSART